MERFRTHDGIELAYDDLVGSPQRLADAIPGGRAAVVAGDHLTAVADPAFAATMVSFLDEHAE